MEKKKKGRSSASVGSNVVRKKPTSGKNTRNVRPAGSKVKKSRNGKEKKKMSKIKKFFIIVALLFILVILVGIGISCGIFFSDKFALSREDLLLSNANTIIPLSSIEYFCPSYSYIFIPFVVSNSNANSSSIFSTLIRLYTSLSNFSYIIYGLSL